MKIRLKIKHIVLLVIITLIVIVIFTSKAISNPDSLYLPKDNRVISYKVYWGIIPLGEAQITINSQLYNGREAVLIEAKANTSGIMSKIFDAKINISSIVNPIDMTSVVYRESIWNRGEEESKVIYYDQEKNALKTEEGVYRILPQTHDPLSALFSLKNRDFNLGDSFEINVNSNQSNYGVSFNVIDEVESKGGKIYVLKGVSERRFGDKARHRVEFTIYLEADNHIPVLIKAFTPLGPISIKAVSN